MAKEKFNKSIHGLRGVAVLAIFLFHSYVVLIAQGLEPGSFKPFINNAFGSLASGVDLFFMISGYLITASLARHRNIKSFLIDRFIRIYPVLLTAEVLLYIAAPHLYYKWTVDMTPGELFVSFIENILLLPGIFPIYRILGPAWSLSYEFLFYYFSASICFVWPRQRVIGYAMLILLLPALFYFYAGAVNFLCGVTTYMLLQHPDWFNGALKKVRTFLLSDWGVINLVLFFGYLALRSLAVDTGFHGNFAGSPKDWLGFFSSDDVPERFNTLITYASSIIGFCIFVQLANGSKLISKILGCRPLQGMATISYSFYIWHWPVYGLLKGPMGRLVTDKLHLPFAMGWAVFSLPIFAITLMVSTISYIVLEKHAGRLLKARFTKPTQLPPYEDASAASR